VHMANGYLLDCFLQTKTNLRTDAYGGSQEGRFRLAKEVVEAVGEVFPGRVGVRISPNGVFNDMGSVDSREMFLDYTRRFAALNLAYLHVLVGLAFGFHSIGEPLTCAEIRKAYGGGVIIANCGYDRASAEKEVESGDADMVSFGRLFISNPDLVERFQKGAPLNPDAELRDWSGQQATPEAGFTNFPTMDA
jgi:N-ethylmaleimide reductase